MKDIPLNNSLDFMQNIDMLTVNDSEGLLQSPKRYNMTGANTYVLLSPQTTCTDLEKQFSKETILILCMAKLTLSLPVVWEPD